MSQNEKQERTNSSVEIEDLTVEESAQNEVNGGNIAGSSNNLKQLGIGCHNIASTYPTT